MCLTTVWLQYVYHVKTDKIGKQHYFTNRHDIAAEFMVADEKLETLRCDWHREKRPYWKRRTEKDTWTLRSSSSRDL